MLDYFRSVRFLTYVLCAMHALGIRGSLQLSYPMTVTGILYMCQSQVILMKDQNPVRSKLTASALGILVGMTCQIGAAYGQTHSGASPKAKSASPEIYFDSGPRSPEEITGYLQVMRRLIDRYNTVVSNLVLSSGSISNDPEKFNQANLQTQKLAAQIRSVAPPREIAGPHKQLATTLSAVDGFLQAGGSGAGGITEAMGLANQTRTTMGSYHNAVISLIDSHGLSRSLDPFAAENENTKSQAASGLQALQGMMMGGGAGSGGSNSDGGSSFGGGGNSFGGSGAGSGFGGAGNGFGGSSFGSSSNNGFGSLGGFGTNSMGSTGFKTGRIARPSTTGGFGSGSGFGGGSALGGSMGGIPGPDSPEGMASRTAAPDAGGSAGGLGALGGLLGGDSGGGAGGLGALGGLLGGGSGGNGGDGGLGALGGMLGGGSGAGGLDPGKLLQQLGGAGGAEGLGGLLKQFGGGMGGLGGSSGDGGGMGGLGGSSGDGSDMNSLMGDQ